MCLFFFLVGGYVTVKCQFFVTVFKSTILQLCLAEFFWDQCSLWWEDSSWRSLEQRGTKCLWTRGQLSWLTFPGLCEVFFFFFLVNPSFVICGQVILCFECHKMAIILFHLYPHCNIRFPHFSCFDAFSCLMCLKYYFNVVKFKALSVLYCAFNWYVLIFWLFWFLWVVHCQCNTHIIIGSASDTM